MQLLEFVGKMIVLINTCTVTAAGDFCRIVDIDFWVPLTTTSTVATTGIS